MKKINPCKLGSVVGGVVAIWHSIWAIIVFSGHAKEMLDWSLEMHFMHIEYSIEPFDFKNAILLILLSGMVGYVVGSVSALLWNATHCGSCAQDEAYYNKNL